ncbi:MAG: HAD hydrolase-like protein, partial [bacterium]
MWKVILFDLDGTLTDSGEGIMKSFAYAVQKGFGIHVEDYHALKRYIGQPLAESFQEYAHLDEEQAKEAVRLYRERYVPVGIYENRPYGGIPELLAELRAHGLTLAVASSKPTVMCEEVLRHFGLRQHFALVVGSELDGRRTNKADVIAEILRIFGMENRKDEVVLVGDSPFDVKGAKKAGIDALGVAYGYGEREELEDLWPACIVDSVEELRNVLIGQALYSIPSSESALANAAPSGDKFPESVQTNVLPTDGGLSEPAPANAVPADGSSPESAPANVSPADGRLPESASQNAGWRGQPFPPVPYGPPTAYGHSYGSQGDNPSVYGQPYPPQTGQPTPYGQPYPPQAGQPTPYGQPYPPQIGQPTPYGQPYPPQIGQPTPYC